MSADQSPEDARPKVGQVWADNDWRSKGREVLIVAIDETHATVEVTAAQPLSGRPTTIGRQTRIRLNRFKPTSTGYRLIDCGGCGIDEPCPLDAPHNRDEQERSP